MLSAKMVAIFLDLNVLSWMEAWKAVTVFHPLLLRIRQLAWWTFCVNVSDYGNTYAQSAHSKQLQ